MSVDRKILRNFISPKETPFKLDELILLMSTNFLQ